MTPTKLYLLLGAIVVIIIGILLAVFSKPVTHFTTTAVTTPGFPIGASTQNANGSQTIPSSDRGTNSVPMMTIAGAGSAQISVDDFLHNGVTEEDVENPGNYYLAGSADYCTKQGICPKGATSTDFAITYDADAQFFTIALTEEPIGQARLNAEAFLEKTLGLSNEAMCSLRYYLGTDISTNLLYAGKNLGFDFCAGSTELPP